MPKPRRPAGLARSAKTWDDVVSRFDLRPDELRLVEDACREADLIDRLERATRGKGLMVKGSQGQPVANPLLGELRQHRNALAGIWRTLGLPDDGETGTSAAGARSSAARELASARWSNRGAK